MPDRELGGGPGRRGPQEHDAGLVARPLTLQAQVIRREGGHHGNPGLRRELETMLIQVSVEKVDTMKFQAISPLDHLYKELNNYMMRLRELYGWHSPELSKS